MRPPTRMASCRRTSAMVALIILPGCLAIKMDEGTADDAPSDAAAYDDDDGGGSDDDSSEPNAGGLFSSVVHPSQSHAHASISHKSWCSDGSLGWCETWACGGEAWCKDGKRPAPCETCCLSWCESWSCGGEAWCQGGARPAQCVGCCPRWCDTWRCDGAWCAEDPNAHPEPCKPCYPSGGGGGSGGAAGAAGGGGGGTIGAEAPAFGPVHGAGTTGGWVLDHGQVKVGEFDGTVRFTGDTRAYLVEDYTRSAWRDHKYMRIDPTRSEAFSASVDLSNVPCGCLACVYMVGMHDPSSSRLANYCDMGGFGDRSCYEWDLIEANREASRTF